MKFRLLIITAALATCSVACNKNGNGEALSPSEQKAHIESTVDEAINILSRSQWEEKADIVANLVEKAREYRTDKVDAYFENLLSSFESISKSTIYETVLDLTKVTGHFTVQDDEWVREDASDLSITMTCDGKTYVATVKVTGNYDVKIPIDEYEDYYEDEYHYAYMLLPKKVEARLTENGAEFISVDYRIDWTDVNRDKEVSLGDAISTSESIRFADYVMTVSEASISSKTASVGYAFSKGNSNIISLKFTGSFSDISELEDLEDEEDLMYILKTVKVDADFLEKVGFYGSVNSSKLNKLEDQLISIEDEKKAVKKVCSTLEDACDIYMYFNGNRADKQAYLGFEPMLDDDEWYVEPVIRFSDGSSYQLVEDYFSENNFESILNRLENRLEEIEGWAENNF